MLCTYLEVGNTVRLNRVPVRIVTLLVVAGHSELERSLVAYLVCLFNSLSNVLIVKLVPKYK